MAERARAPGGLVIVLGGGIAGLAAADRLCRAGWRVRVIERSTQAGGTHRARHIGPYTFDAGAIFYEEGAHLFNLAPGLKDICPQVMRLQRRLAPDGTIRHYPFEPREFLRQPLPLLARAVIDLAWSRLTVRRDGTLDALSRKRLGRSFFESSGLASYITRFHHVSPREIDESFFFRRMAFVERMTRLDELARLAWRSLPWVTPPGKHRRPLHVRPRAGFEPLFTPIVDRLGRAGAEFCFGEELLSLRREGGLFTVATSRGTHCAEAVVSTIPLDSLHRAMFGAASGLVSLDMTTLFVSAARLDHGLGNVLYNFHPLGRWKRATIYSRIYPGSAGREFLAVEATIAPAARPDPAAAFEDFRRHLEGLGLADDLALEGHEHVERCYPLYAPGSAGIISQVLHRIARTGVILAGRQGRFEYLPTSSGVIRRVMEELDDAGLMARASGLAA